MIVTIKKNTIFINEFKLKCAIGKRGIKKKTREGDKITPLGVFEIGNLYYRSDRIKKFETNLKSIVIKKNMGWCDDPLSTQYNRLINNISKFEFKYEKLFRNDNKYDFILPIKYNYKNTIKNKGSAIFFHLTKNYKPTAGCIAMEKKDFLIFLKLIKKGTKVRII